MTKTPENRLISEDSDADAVEPVMPAEARPAVTRTTRRVNGRTTYPGRRMVTARIKERLFLLLKIISVETDTPMMDMFETALTDFANSHVAKKKFRADGRGQ